MDKLEALAVLVAIAVAAIAFHIFVMPLNEAYISVMSVKTECLPGDADCLEEVRKMRMNCDPPTESILVIGNETNRIIIKVTTYMENGKCITKEEIIDDSSGLAPYNLTGREIECEIDEEVLEETGQIVCDNSLAGFLAPGSSDTSTTVSDGETVFQAYCSLDADDCKEEASTYIKNCMNAEITLDQELDHTAGGLTYWTLYIDVDERPVEYTATQKLQPRCVIFHKLLNAVNLPPEIPEQVIGMNMTCTIDLDLFPINGISVRWCEGELVNYIQVIYP